MVDRAVHESAVGAGQSPRLIAFARAVRGGGTARGLSRSLACFIRVLLVQLLPVCFLLALTQVAEAATVLPRVNGSLDGADAPICDPTGASAPAPADIPEVDRGRVEELPCEAFGALFGVPLGEPDPSRVAAAPQREGSHAPDGATLERTRFEGAPLVAVPFPARAEPALLPFASADGLAPRPGHRSPLYRPPLCSERGSQLRAAR